VLIPVNFPKFDSYSGLFRLPRNLPWSDVTLTTLDAISKLQGPSDETAKRAALRPEGGYVDLNLTRGGGRRTVFA
jgi:hypothetical protein